MVFAIVKLHPIPSAKHMKETAPEIGSENPDFFFGETDGSFLLEGMFLGGSFLRSHPHILRTCNPQVDPGEAASMIPTVGLASYPTLFLLPHEALYIRYQKTRTIIIFLLPSSTGRYFMSPICSTRSCGASC